MAGGRKGARSPRSARFSGADRGCGGRKRPCRTRCGHGGGRRRSGWPGEGARGGLPVGVARAGHVAVEARGRADRGDRREAGRCPCGSLVLARGGRRGGGDVDPRGARRGRRRGGGDPGRDLGDRGVSRVPRGEGFVHRGGARAGGHRGPQGRAPARHLPGGRAAAAARRGDSRGPDAGRGRDRRGRSRAALRRASREGAPRGCRSSRRWIGRRGPRSPS